MWKKSLKIKRDYLSLQQEQNIGIYINNSEAFVAETCRLGQPKHYVYLSYSKRL